MHDLRRLLDSEDLHDVQILVTSAKTGAGIEELRKLLVSDRVGAAAPRLPGSRADVDKVVARFEPYGTTEGADSAARPGRRGRATAGGRVRRRRRRDGHRRRCPQRPRAAGAGLCRLAGELAGRAPDEPRSGQEDQAGQDLGRAARRHRRPVGRAAGGDRQRADPGRRRCESRRCPAVVADRRAAVRSRAADIPAAVGAEIGAALPADAAVDRWWRMIGVRAGPAARLRARRASPGRRAAHSRGSRGRLAACRRCSRRSWLIPWAAA